MVSPARPCSARTPGSAPAEARRLACDADILPAVLGSDSQLLDLGRTTRLFAGDLRQAIVLRDRGCVFPGCHRDPRDCDAHHIRPWTATGAHQPRQRRPALPHPPPPGRTRPERRPSHRTRTLAHAHEHRRHPRSHPTITQRPTPTTPTPQTIPPTPPAVTASRSSSGDRPRHFGHLDAQRRPHGVRQPGASLNRSAVDRSIRVAENAGFVNAGTRTVMTAAQTGTEDWTPTVYVRSRYRPPPTSRVEPVT